MKKQLYCLYNITTDERINDIQTIDRILDSYRMDWGLCWVCATRNKTINNYLGILYKRMLKNGISSFVVDEQEYTIISL